MLLKEHVNPSVTSSNGTTPLHLSRNFKLTQVKEEVREREREGSYSDRDREMVMRFGVFQMLLDAGGSANVTDKEGNTPLHSVCSDLGSRDVAASLVQLLVCMCMCLNACACVTVCMCQCACACVDGYVSVSI